MDVFNCSAIYNNKFSESISQLIYFEYFEIEYEIHIFQIELCALAQIFLKFAISWN